MGVSNAHGLCLFCHPQALNSNDNNNKENGWMDRLKKASLKDLCNEDKKRIADLIRELARYLVPRIYRRPGVSVVRCLLVSEKYYKMFLPQKLGVCIKGRCLFNWHS